MNLLKIRLVSFSGSVFRPHHGPNRLMVSRIDMTSFVIFVHDLVKFHQDPIKEFIKNAVKTPFE